MPKRYCQGIDCAWCDEPEPCKYREMNRKEEKMVQQEQQPANNFITIGDTIINTDNICFVSKTKDLANVYFNNSNKCLQVDFEELKGKLLGL